MGEVALITLRGGCILSPPRIQIIQHRQGYVDQKGGIPCIRPGKSHSDYYYYYYYLYADGKGCHALDHQEGKDKRSHVCSNWEEFRVQYLAQGHFDM